MFLTLLLFAVALCSATAKDPRCEELLKPQEFNQVGPGKWIMHAFGGDKNYFQATKNVKSSWVKLTSTDEANVYSAIKKMKIGDQCFVVEGQGLVHDNNMVTITWPGTVLESTPLVSNQGDVATFIADTQYGEGDMLVTNKNMFLFALEGTEVNKESIKHFKKQGRCAGMQTRPLSSDDLCPE
ncbi:hypothetical protein WMY93_004259 [Mugilogobius chulae]|uniref:Uncharacterized protein n=1 Tax=Mugilogobius chulae TaxID=88201 RepID=A0AAW0PRT6_9GOBI